MENQDIYLPFEIAYSLGSPLPAPKNSTVYITKAYDLDGRVVFHALNSNKEQAIKELSEFALEQLEMLDADSPWMGLDYQERVSMEMEEYNNLYSRQLKKWLEKQTRLSIIEEFFGEAYEIKEEKIK